MLRNNTMNVIDKANEYIGHPVEIDEGYEIYMKRSAYIQGYRDAVDNICEYLRVIALDSCPYQDYMDVHEMFINDLRKKILGD